jgi:hypothetical protein
MPFILEPLLAEDIPRFVELYFAAFQNAHSFGCFPRVPTVEKWWLDMIVDEFKDPNSHFHKAVDSTTGVIAAVSKWDEAKPRLPANLPLPEWPEGADKRMCNETFGLWMKKHEDVMRDRPHWCRSMNCMITRLT